MSNQIEHVTIVGGGTAGWMTAVMLTTELNANPSGKKIEITLVESPTVPSIGVGEATLITLPGTLEDFGINEREFIARSNASFKLAVRFADWFTDSSGQRPIFYHPFNAPPSCAGRLPAYYYRKFGPPKPGMTLADSIVPNVAIRFGNSGFDVRGISIPDLHAHTEVARTEQNFGCGRTLGIRLAGTGVAENQLRAFLPEGIRKRPVQGRQFIYGNRL